MEIKTVSIIGLGALGVLFGHHLSQNMPETDLRIVADSQRISRYEKDGVYCNGERCTFRYVTPDVDGKPADLAIFAVKYNGLDDAVSAMARQIGEHTVILSALNGITSETVIGQAYGMDKMLYCVAQGMDAVKVGNRLTYTHMGKLCFGNKEPGIVSEKAREVAAFFDRVNFPYEVETDMYRRLWGKFMVNVGANQAIAVYGKNYADVQKKGNTRDVMVAAMREVIALSGHAGIGLGEADLTYWIDIIDSLSPQGKPSMRQDVEASRPSEVALFAGTVLSLAEKYSMQMPVNQDLYDKIHAIEAQY